jgi:hypothetical protein
LTVVKDMPAKSSTDDDNYTHKEPHVTVSMCDSDGVYEQPPAAEPPTHSEPEVKPVSLKIRISLPVAPAHESATKPSPGEIYVLQIDAHITGSDKAIMSPASKSSAKASPKTASSKSKRPPPTAARPRVKLIAKAAELLKSAKTHSSSTCDVPTDATRGKKTAASMSDVHDDKQEEEDGSSAWNCPVCAVEYVEGGPDMIGCDKCDRWYHW